MTRLNIRLHTTSFQLRTSVHGGEILVSSVTPLLDYWMHPQGLQMPPWLLHPYSAFLLKTIYRSVAAVLLMRSLLPHCVWSVHLFYFCAINVFEIYYTISPFVPIDPPTPLLCLFQCAGPTEAFWLQGQQRTTFPFQLEPHSYFVENLCELFSQPYWSPMCVLISVWI